MAAKRFTDTGKWSKPSFDELTNAEKLMWIYMCDTCDHAGIWDFNWRLLRYHITVDDFYSIDKFKEAFRGKIEWLSETKVFIPSFVDFQYGALNPENRVHHSVIERLKKEGAYKARGSSVQGAKDKDKDKDKDKAKDKDKDLEQEFQIFYAKYPRKVGKGDALKAYLRERKAGATHEGILISLDRFIAFHQSAGTEPKFIPYPATMLSRWKDHLDEEFGSTQMPKSAADEEFEARERAIFEKGPA